MANIIKRFGDIMSANINALLDRAEEPLKEFMARQVEGSALKLFCDLAHVDTPEDEEETGDLPLRILNPSPAAIVKVSEKYRYKLVIKCRFGRNFRSLVSESLEEFMNLREFAAVSVLTDCNPDSIL